MMRFVCGSAFAGRRQADGVRGRLTGWLKVWTAAPSSETGPADRALLHRHGDKGLQVVRAEPSKP